MADRKAASVGRNALSLSLGQAATMGVNFGAWVYLSRTLGPEGFGVLTLGLAVLSYFLLAVALGLDVGGVRQIARAAPGGDPVQSLVGEVLGLRLVLAGVSIVAYLGVAAWVGGSSIAFAALAVLGVQLGARAIQLDWVYQGVERMQAVAARNAGAGLVLAALAVLLVRDSTHLLAAAVVVGAAPLIANGVLFGVYSHEYGAPRPRLSAWRPLLIPALPLAASAFVSEVYYNLDKIMLEAFRTTTEVGYYGAGYKVYALAVAPAAALFPAFFPSLARALGRPARALAGARFAGTLLLLGLPVLAAAPFIADSLVAVLFGAAYAPSAPALKLLLVNAGVVYVAMAYGVPLTAWDRERAYFVVVALGAGLNVVLNLVLINPYGTVGAAGATLVTEAAILCGMAWLHWRTAGSLYPEAWRRALLPAATVGIAAWAVCGTWPVALWVPTLVSVWALSAAASGGLRAFRAALSPPAP